MKLLHIDSSITGPQSISRQLSAEIVAEIARQAPHLQVARRDLEADPLPHLDGELFAALQAQANGEPIPPAPPAELQRSAAVLQEFLDADIIVVGAPMYNFTISSQLKTWVDRILIGGKTFVYTESGPKGLAGDKKVIIASARGGLYSAETPGAESDFQERYLQRIFGFVGVSDVTVVRAEGIALGPEQRTAALSAALTSIPDVARQMAPGQLAYAQ